MWRELLFCSHLSNFHIILKENSYKEGCGWALQVATDLEYRCGTLLPGPPPQGHDSGNPNPAVLGGQIWRWGTQRRLQPTQTTMCSALCQAHLSKNPEHFLIQYFSYPMTLLGIRRYECCYHHKCYTDRQKGCSENPSKNCAKCPELEFSISLKSVTASDWKRRVGQPCPLV